jgi:hypothetical protein
MKTFQSPIVSGTLTVLAAISCVGGIVLMVSGNWVHGVGGLVASFSLLAWGQMLNYIARAAHYAEQTAELLAGVHSGSNSQPKILRAPESEPIVYPEPTTSVEQIENARRAMESVKSVYGRGAAQ